jgi:hypothetical protein
MPALFVVVSVSLITPDFATAFPPGVTVHVLAVLASDGVMAALAARIAVAVVSKAAAAYVRISSIPSSRSVLALP